MNQIDILRRLIDSQLRRIGSPVSNINGAVAGQSPAILTKQDQRFLVAQIAGTRLVTPDEFYSTFTSSETRNYQVIQAVEGMFAVDALTKDANTPSTFLIRSATENPGPINISISIETDSNSSEFAVYVDGVLQRKATGSITMPLAFSAGRSLLEIVAVCKVFGLAVPPSVRFIYDLDVVPTPVWSSIRVGYLDPVLGGIAVQLEWFNDNRVGGWIVFRRVLTYLSPIFNVSSLDNNGEFAVELSARMQAPLDPLFLTTVQLTEASTTTGDPDGIAVWDIDPTFVLSGSGSVHAAVIGTPSLLPYNPTLVIIATGGSPDTTYNFEYSTYRTGTGYISGTLLDAWEQTIIEVVSDANGEVELSFVVPLTEGPTVNANAWFSGFGFEATSTAQLADYTADIAIGGDILAGSELMGTALSTSYDALENVTIVRIRIDPTRKSISDTWVGREASVGQFTEQTRIRRTTKGGAISWTDISVSSTLLYEYVLQAFGLFDELQLSAFSEIRRIVPGDIIAPGSIIFDAGFPIVNVDTATAKFLTPSDQDYEGVKVIFFNAPLNGFGTSTGSNTILTLIDTNKAWLPNAFVGYTIVITGGAGVGQSASIVTNNENTIGLNSNTPWTVIPDEFSSFQIYQLENIMTDYGLPGTKDEIKFTVNSLGRYYFCTFDRAMNTQTIYEAAFWDYDGQEDLQNPITNALVYDRTADGKQSQTQFGITLYSVPPGREIVADTFEETDGQSFDFYDAGIFATTGNTTRSFQDPSKSWTASLYVGKSLRITSIGANYNRIATIISNGGTTINIDVDLPVPPNNMTYQILAHAPNNTPTATEYWQLNDPSLVNLQNSRVEFVGTPGSGFSMYINCKRAVDFRYEAVISRGIGPGNIDFGNNITYKGSADNMIRWEYGLIPLDLQTVQLRYRNNNGTGIWNNLTIQSWEVGTALTLIVEVESGQVETHTFKVADNYGHDERILGRTQVANGAVENTYIGWTVEGSSSDGILAPDSFDQVRVMDYNALVRIKYKLLPYEDPVNKIGEFLEIPLWKGTATSGSLQFLTDNTKLWKPDELTNAFIRITSGAGVDSDLSIATNSKTVITPNGSFKIATGSDSQYLIYEKYYTGTERLRWWATRLPKQPQFLLYHGERGTAIERPENRLLIDSNSIPEVFLTLEQIEPIGGQEGFLQATIIPDDDVASYRLLLRKGNWPTANLPTGTIDDTPGSGGAPPPDPALELVNLKFIGEFEGIDPFNTWDIDEATNVDYSSTKVTNISRGLNASARFELRKTDTLVNGGSRTQLKLSTLGASNGGIVVPITETAISLPGNEVWFGFSVYIPIDWIVETSFAPETIMEVTDSTRKPFFELQINGEAFEFYKRVGLGFTESAWTTSIIGSTPVIQGQWNDFVIHARWSFGADGFIVIYKNGTQITNNIGPNCYSDITVPPMFKIGIYKWSWDAAALTSIATTRVLYIDSVRISNDTKGSYIVVAPRE